MGEQFKVFSNIRFIPKTNNLALSIEINSKILERNENFILSAVYLPPVGSVYCGEDDFDLLDLMINDLQQITKNIILLGDFNAKTKEMPDFILLNENDALYQLEGIFDQKCIKKDRTNQDKHEVDLF